MDCQEIELPLAGGLGPTPRSVRAGLENCLHGANRRWGTGISPVGCWGDDVEGPNHPSAPIKLINAIKSSSPAALLFASNGCQLRPVRPGRPRQAGAVQAKHQG